MWTTASCDSWAAEFSSSSKPWYLYSFDRGTPSSGYTFADRSLLDSIACHADDLIYLCNMVNSTYFGVLNKTMSDKDLNMVDEMVELWTSSVISGVPYTTALGNASWPRYSTSGQYLQISSGSNTSLEVKTSNFKDKMKFWENLTAMLY